MKQERIRILQKIAMTEAIIEAKTVKGVTWAEIAGAAGLSEVFVTSACFGQNSLSGEEAGKLTDFLDLGERAKAVKAALQLCPLKAQNLDSVSKDPLIYRFYEIAYVYGDTIKAIIHEKFGDGIMSAIDFDMYIDKVDDPKGDRVKVTMSGKFLAYKKW